MKKFMILLGLFATRTAGAQEALQNGGNLQLHSGAAMACHGSFTNASGASLTNNGALHLKRNGTNNGTTVLTASGTLLFNGSVAQTLSGSQPFITRHLQTDNSAGITLSSSLQLYGTHTFSAGRIATGSGAFLVYEAGADYNGATDARHVTGTVKKKGTTDFTYPVGDGTYLRAVTLRNLTATSEFNVAYAGATTDINNYHAPILSIDPHGQWNVERITGAAAEVTLGWDQSKAGFKPYHLNDLLVAYYLNGYWENAGGTATGTTSSGTVTSASTSIFGMMAIGSRSYPVPVKFIGLTGERRNGGVDIRFTTSEEKDVAQYTIERSLDGRNFQSVNTITARNSGNEERYATRDASAPQVKIYYRIKALDNNGAIRFSPIATVMPEGGAGFFQLLSNPVRQAIVLKASVTPGRYTYELHNEGGALVRSGSFEVSGGEIRLPVDALPAGAYFLHIGGGQPQSFKLLVQ